MSTLQSETHASHVSLLNVCCACSWCTKDVAVGSGCGDNSDHLCNTTQMAVTVTITAVTGYGDAGRRLSESGESWSEDTDDGRVHVGYTVSSTTELDTAAAKFGGAALSAALQDAGGALGPFEPESLVTLDATYRTVVEYAVVVQANTLAEAETVGEVASAAVGGISLCLAGPGSCLSITTSAAAPQVRCGEGHGFNPWRTECIPCRGVTAGIGQCIACGVGKEPDRRRARCIACTGNFSSLTGTCELCPPGTTASSDHARCVVLDSVAVPRSAETSSNRPLEDMPALAAQPSCMAVQMIMLGVHSAAATWITLYWLFGASCIANNCRDVLHRRSAALLSVSSMSGAVIDILLTCALQLSNAGMMVRLASLPRVVSCHMPHSCSSHRTQASPDNKSTGRCNHDRCCTEHWERVGTRAGSASQSNGSDNSCGLSSTDLGDRD
eukprot:COSAG03_NODE_3490_length_1985_cov_1.473489_1_plen_440_part_10